MALAGGAILVVAILAAAISALGPKYRPTPLLTPLFAGVFAALLVTTAVYAAHSQIAPKRNAAVAAQHVQAKPAVKPVETAPVIEPTAIEPVLPQAPAPVLGPSFDTASPAAADKVEDQFPATAVSGGRAADAGQMPRTAPPWVARW